MMESYIYDYLLEIKTLSPVFIGNGESIGKKQYLYDRRTNTVQIPDMRKMFDGLHRMRKIDAYEAYLLETDKDLGMFFRENDIKPADYKNWIRYSAPVADPELSARSIKEILSFVKDPYGLPYIPGSSLKGALRNILQSAWYLDHKEEARKLAEEVKRAPFSSKRSFMAREDRGMDVESMHRELFEDIRIDDQNNDILRGLVIGDSKALSLKDLCITQKIEVTVKGEVRAINILRECIRPGVTIQFPISIDRRVCPYTGKMLREAIEKFYTRYQEQFIRCFRKAPAINGNSTTFFLGGGTGYASKTCTYSIMEGQEAIQTVGKILNHTLPARQKKEHDHLNDDKRGASPHILKCTKYGAEIVQMGACCVTRFKRINKQ